MPTFRQAKPIRVVRFGVPSRGLFAFIAEQSHANKSDRAMRIRID
jgi:hypothetical protein